MKIVYNRFIPFKGFGAINLFGVIFARKECKVTPRTINHEKIHTAQMRELGYIGFYVLYFLEWLYRLAVDTNRAYRRLVSRSRLMSINTTTHTWITASRMLCGVNRIGDSVWLIKR